MITYSPDHERRSCGDSFCGLAGCRADSSRSCLGSSCSCSRESEIPSLGIRVVEASNKFAHQCLFCVRHRGHQCGQRSKTHDRILRNTRSVLHMRRSPRFLFSGSMSVFVANGQCNCLQPISGRFVSPDLGSSHTNFAATPARTVCTTNGPPRHTQNPFGSRQST